jgi:hypothetical protein
MERAIAEAAVGRLIVEPMESALRSLPRDRAKVKLDRRCSFGTSCSFPAVDRGDVETTRP